MKAVAVLFCALISQCLAATTVEILAADPEMSTLVSLVTQAGLVDALNSGKSLLRFRCIFRLIIRSTFI